ncbi:glutamine-hydrolyzing GMP synthase [Athalassotoga sp.]|uniref:glutamine-hydrolyzing GMP synthase n=1 Tax=Athalassotoga sp. TaxID=2022597 RepID=UPI003CFDF017
MKIVIIDYGSQYTQLLARRIREMGVFSTVVNSKDFKFDGTELGVILSGGPMSVYDEETFELPEELFNRTVPVLGICYGMQLIAKRFGGKVERGKISEYGFTKVSLSHSVLFEGIPSEITAWMSHGDTVKILPKGFVQTAKSQNDLIAAFEYKNIHAIQFHPEVAHTEHGTDILKNFVFKICKAQPQWTMESFVDSKVKEIKSIVKDKKVIGAISGGVDSTIVTVLTSKAIGDHLIPIFVNHGLLRIEDMEVPKDLKRIGIDVKVVDASNLFFERLKGIEDPEKKRKTIGETFIEVFEKEALSYDAEFLLQGTIYPDAIESATTSKSSVKIKSHHNVGGLPERMNLKLLEPIRELFKDEVRRVGKELGLPNTFIQRHPFPGPGLAVRIIGEVTREKADILRSADDILTKVLIEKGEYSKIWQAFAVLLSSRSVGVKGDARSYGYVLAIRAVDSVDGMTASWHDLPHDILKEISTKITGQIPEIGRIVYDITDKPPSTIEWE